MAPEKETWQQLAKTKYDSLVGSIPKKWRLSTIPTADEQRDVTGAFIQRFLSDREIEITEMDANAIVIKTTNGRWSAEEVATAFCHRASLAQQLVISSEPLQDC